MQKNLKPQIMIIKMIYLSNTNRVSIPVLNPNGNSDVVYLFDPELVRETVSHEGKHPFRGDFFDGLRLMRLRRSDCYQPQCTGLITEDGEDWQKIRSKVQQIMMRPESSLFYTDQLQEVSDDFVRRVERLRDNVEGTHPGDFLDELFAFSMESMAMVALDTRLGCLEDNPDSSTVSATNTVRDLTKNFSDLLLGFPAWKFLPAPRMHSAFRRMEDDFNAFTDFSVARVTEARRKMAQKKSKSGTYLNEAKIDKNIFE